MDGKLLGKAVKQVIAVAGVKAFLILPVAALHFALVAGRVWTGKLVSDAHLICDGLKQNWQILYAVKKRVVNSTPLPVWMRSTRLSRRAYPLTTY